jgi:putative FmdB family regulatory protein
MPLYEYECKSCGKRTEVLQRFGEAPLAACPHCGGEVKKLFSAPAVQFKGSGFYKTDYAAKPAGKPESGEGKSASSEGKDKADAGKDSGKDSGKKETATAETKPAGGASAASSSGSSGE